MKIKKAAAAVLAVFMLAGFSGCDKNKKDRSEIEDLLEDYVSAINDFDLDGIVSLSDWDESDPSYTAFKSTLGCECSSDEQKTFYTCIASTVTLDYEAEEIDIKGDTATLNAKYRIVNWSEAIRGKSFSGLKDLLGLIRDCDETRTVRVRFNFAKEGGKWKLSQVSNIVDLLDFVPALKDIPVGNTAPTGTDPTIDTQPSAGNPGGIFSYYDSVAEYIRILEENREGINDFADDFGVQSCGIIDIDGDGNVELYFFIEEDGPEFKTGTFCVYGFDPRAGKAVPFVICKDIAKLGVQSGGDYIVFVTGNKLGIVYTDGEEALFTISTDIYYMDPANDFDEYYMREMIYYDYDPETDTENYKVYHYEGGIENGERVMYPTESWNYEDPLTEYYKDASIILEKNYNIQSGDLESPLSFVTVAGNESYSEMIGFLKSLK